MVSRVDSWPPCWLAVLVNTVAGLLINSPESHWAMVPSRKYFMAAAMLPKRVGLPKASAAQFLKSAAVA